MNKVRENNARWGSLVIPCCVVSFSLSDREEIVKIVIILSFLSFGSIGYANPFAPPNPNAAHFEMQQKAGNFDKLANRNYVMSHASNRAKKQARYAQEDSSTIVSNGRGQKTGRNMINSVVVESGSQTGDITIIVTDSDSTLMNTQ